MPGGTVRVSFALEWVARTGQFCRDMMNGRRKLAAQLIVLMVAAALLEGAGLLLLVPILLFVTDPGALSTGFAEFGAALVAPDPLADPMKHLMALVALFALVIVIRAAVILARDSALARLKIGFTTDLRSELLRCVAEQPWERLSQLRHGRVTHLVSGDVQSSGAAAQGLIQASVAAVVLVVQIAVAFIISPVLASLTIALVVLLGFLSLPMLRRAYGAGMSLTGANLRFTGILLQFLGGLKVANSHNLQGVWLARLMAQQAEIANHQLSLALQRSWSGVFLAALSAFVAAAALLVGYGILQLRPAVLLTMLFVLSRTGGPAMQIQQGLQMTIHNLPAFVELKRLRDELRASSSSTGAAQEDAEDDAPLEFGAVTLRGVTFLYESGPSAGGVRNADLSIAVGETIGVCGASGAGKTTLADLVAGLLTPQAGHISVGERILEPRLLFKWRERIGYVAQDTVLFDDTIRNNLLFGSKGVSDRDLFEALHVADATGLVERLELGLESVVGERGVLLSGGERQRLAIARALLRKADILILDEATSALDEEGERRILLRLRDRVPRPTLFLISHRMLNTDLCDRLIQVDQGELIERPARARLSAVRLA